ncbi:YbaB/EbfC family nucleoid-associated protein [Vagococcus penaei]|uniref:Nucleoid-associated protein BW732_08900 n=2 Tax=Vagococcus penaei TaxID=633807 RepID=A0A1Q2D922_9ENTE|nr:YbaB/EbfC family nucleoid-associated protein [Vagococcus penaei]RSU05874.1 YbaB/EbfC family nucleoid-associated protein [Vagococcus penaei]
MRGMGNMQGMMKQMQKMQKEMEATKANLDQQEFKGQAGNGLVEITMTGDKRVKDVMIKPEVADPDDIEMIQDLVLAATNNVLEMIDAETERVMGKYAKSIPGM